ncbi:MAG: BMP family ABC transporter substrate-binding protein [Actinobacteria bacterium]|nr:BMP family ABC transporter substrate-binding protein [Actinomycetota bacterium]
MINDKTLGQLNISNIYFREDQGAYLAGVVAALSTKRKVVGFVGSEPELLSSFQKGVKSISSKINVVNISYPDEISALQKGLSRVDVAYSTWDGDSTVLTTVLATYSKKVSLIVESPDQYFANLPGAKGVVIASVNKVLNKPIDQLIQAAFANSSLIDVLDESAGIYGREYGVINGGIRITMYGPISNRVKSALTRALNQLKQG